MPAFAYSWGLRSRSLVRDSADTTDHEDHVSGLIGREVATAVGLLANYENIRFRPLVSPESHRHRAANPHAIRRAPTQPGLHERDGEHMELCLPRREHEASVDQLGVRREAG
ncbi:hypothetical protein [Nocardia cyriacigeorgica]|uniref:hypothetical protein n=1 Tax=Nocardia cyriacigeorgica TaxID=135487 RepID=UPI002457B9D8|nr:hypothetical protein [Nocardia cyriacigeorgica]